MLMNPVIADYLQAYGRGGLRARALGRLENLARVYRYTVEFGLVQQIMQRAIAFTAVCLTLSDFLIYFFIINNI